MLQEFLREHLQGKTEHILGKLSEKNNCINEGSTFGNEHFIKCGTEESSWGFKQLVFAWNIYSPGLFCCDTKRKS